MKFLAIIRKVVHETVEIDAPTLEVAHDLAWTGTTVKEEIDQEEIVCVTPFGDAQATQPELKSMTVAEWVFGKNKSGG